MNLFKANFVFRRCAQYMQADYPGALCHFKRAHGSNHESLWSIQDKYILVVGRYISHKEVEINMITTKPIDACNIQILV